MINRPRLIQVRMTEEEYSDARLAAELRSLPLAELLRQLVRKQCDLDRQMLDLALRDWERKP